MVLAPLCRRTSSETAGNPFADVRLPNMLYGRVLRSPYGHALIRSVDTSAAEALPGVKAVVTAADLPEVADKIVDLPLSTP